MVRKDPWPSSNGGRVICQFPGYRRLDSIAATAAGNICDDMTTRLMQISNSAASAGDAPVSAGAPCTRTPASAHSALAQQPC